jgi:hypothetical protein
MSFFKSLLLAIFATCFLTYVLGVSVIEIFDVDIYMGNEIIEPIKAISLSALVIVILVFVALAIILSVFGSIICFFLVVFGAIAMVALGVFWPILLIASAIWLLSRDKQDKHYQAR